MPHPIRRRNLRTAGVEPERNGLLRRGGLADTPHGDARDPCTSNEPRWGEQRRGGECCSRPEEERCRNHVVNMYVFWKNLLAGESGEGGRTLFETARPCAEAIPTPTPSSASHPGRRHEEVVHVIPGNMDALERAHIPRRQQASSAHGWKEGGWRSRP